LQTIETSGSKQAFADLAKQVEAITGVKPTNLEHIKDILSDFNMKNIANGAAAFDKVAKSMDGVSQQAENTRSKVEGVN
jgi:hypothetical protein